MNDLNEKINTATYDTLHYNSGALRTISVPQRSGIDPSRIIARSKQQRDPDRGLIGGRLFDRSIAVTPSCSEEVIVEVDDRLSWRDIYQLLLTPWHWDMRTVINNYRCRGLFKGEKL